MGAKDSDSRSSRQEITSCIHTYGDCAALQIYDFQDVPVRFPTPCSSENISSEPERWSEKSNNPSCLQVGIVAWHDQ